MKSAACEIAQLTKNQLHVVTGRKGDRPFSSDRQLLGAARPARHAAGAWLSRPWLAEAFPEEGATPHTQGLAHAHRSAFVQGHQRLGKVALGAGAPRSCSTLWGSGVGPKAGAVASSPKPGSGGGNFLHLVRGRVKRTLSDRRPLPSVRRSPIGFSGAGALALMRAPALPCEPGFRPAVMGFRP